MTDRDQVAREVLTEAIEHMAGRDAVVAAHELTKLRDERYPAPAPAAPVTVTVEGTTYVREVDGWSVVRSDGRKIMWCGPLSDGAALLDRIASDARRIEELEAANASLKAETDRISAMRQDALGELVRVGHERDEAMARIEELERERDGWQVRCGEMKRERDEARRALEGAEDSLTDIANACETALGQRGSSMTAMECVTAVCRALKAATSQGEGLGAPTPKSEATATVADDGIVSVAPSPAPIPHGAVVEVSGITYQRTEVGDWSSAHRWISRNSHEANTLDALYRALHPVADAATVKRVAQAIFRDRWRGDKGMRDGVRDTYCNDARAALRALGYTIQEDGR